MIRYSEEHETFALKNKASGKYLAIISLSGGMYRVPFQDDPGYWFASLAKYAPSPGQVATIVAVAPIAAVAAATVVRRGVPNRVYVYGDMVRGH